MHIYTFLHVTRTHELSILRRSKMLSDCVASTKMYKHICTYIYQYACIYIFTRHTHIRTLYTAQEQDPLRSSSYSRRNRSASHAHTNSRHTHTRTLYTEQEQDAERLRREYELLLNGMRGLYPPPLP